MIFLVNSICNTIFLSPPGGAADEDVPQGLKPQGATGHVWRQHGDWAPRGQQGHQSTCKVLQVCHKRQDVALIVGNCSQTDPLDMRETDTFWDACKWRTASKLATLRSIVSWYFGHGGSRWVTLWPWKSDLERSRTGHPVTWGWPCNLSDGSRKGLIVTFKGYP